jgi:hypothetical protein
MARIDHAVVRRVSVFRLEFICIGPAQRERLRSILMKAEE